jgi:hypothetical protein
MSRDPILDEVRTIRESIAKEHDYDLNSIFEMFRQNAASSSRVHVNLSTSTVTRVAEAAQLGVAADETSPRR